MNLDDVTPLILTYNETPNLQRTLEAISWAREVVVVDSGSTDGTQQLAEAFPRVRVLVRAFDCHTNQWNAGLDAVQTAWVLTLDADYVCPAELAAELEALDLNGEAYSAAFRYCVLGKPLSGTLYPDRVVLFRPQDSRYVPDGHTQALDVRGKRIRRLDSRILHDDRKPLRRWFHSQLNYAELEAAKLLASDPSSLGWKDRLRRWVLPAPILTFFYCLLVKRLILDGRAGIYYTLQRVLAELILSLALLDWYLRGLACKAESPVPELRPNDIAS